MRSNSIIWAKFESKGYPHKTEIHQGNIIEITRHWAKWIISEGVYLTSTINITIAKQKATLETAARDSELSLDGIKSIFEAAGIDMESEEDQ